MDVFARTAATSSRAISRRVSMTEETDNPPEGFRQIRWVGISFTRLPYSGWRRLSPEPAQNFRIPTQPPRFIMRQRAAKTQRPFSESLPHGAICESAVAGALLPPGLRDSDLRP